MTVYADYTPEEQRILRSSLQAAAVAISAASPGRREETVSEGFAAASFVLESGPRYVGNTLVTSVIVALQQQAQAGSRFPEYTQIASAPDAGARAMDVLRSLVALLDDKATAEESAGYREWLMRIATVTAEAGKEDQGFLGTGGVMVNDAERAALAAVAEVLGVPPTPEPPRGSRR